MYYMPCCTPVSQHYLRPDLETHAVVLQQSDIKSLSAGQALTVVSYDGLFCMLRKTWPPAAQKLGIQPLNPESSSYKI